MGPNGPLSKLIYLVSIGYGGWIDSKFTFMYKGILIIMQDYTKESEQGF